MPPDQARMTYDIVVQPSSVTHYADGCSSAGGDGARPRRSAMNWSNSALSLAKRRRSRNVLNSFCSSSRRRNVSALYSSKAWLPEDEPVPQAHDFQVLNGPASCQF